MDNNECRNKCEALCNIINGKEFCHAEVDYEFTSEVYGVYMTYDGGSRRVRLNYKVWHNCFDANVTGWIFSDDYHDQSDEISTEDMTLEEIADAMKNTAKEINARSESNPFSKEMTA
jgi:hypothetical protein